MFKKVLIVSTYNLSGDSATDITLRSIFRVFPKDSVLLVTTSPSHEPFVKTVVADRVWFTRLRSFFFRIMVNKLSIDRNIVPGFVVKEKTSFAGFKEIIFNIGAAYLDIMGGALSRENLKSIVEFRPNIIYCTSGNINITKLALNISSILNIPIVPHFMDDWINTLYSGNLFLKIPRYFMKYYFNKLLAKSNQGFCISTKMCQEYQTRYNLNFYPLMNIVPNEQIRPPVLPEETPNSAFSISYFGGLHLNRWKTLKFFAEILCKLSESINIVINIKVYTSESDVEKYQHLLSLNNLHFEQKLNYEGVFENMRTSDYLLHIESFDDYVIEFTKYSISTKIPEYLASGVPIIAIGPRNIASIEYLQEHSAAYIIDELKENLVNEIMQIAINKRSGDGLVFNAQNLLKRNHSYDTFFSFQSKIFQINHSSI